MSYPRDYYHSSSRSKRNEGDDRKREERLPSLRHVVGDAYNSRASSPYNFHEVERSLPPISHDSYSGHSGYDKHGYSQRGPTLPPIHSESSASHRTQSTHSASYSSSHHAVYPPTSNSTRASADYPSNDGHSFQVLYTRGGDLLPVSHPSTQPQGMIRGYDIPDESDDPKKRHKCRECGKGFDRPSGLDQHMLRHTGDKPFPCTVSGCDKTFSVRSNMTRHVRTQHYGEEDPDPSDRHESSRYSIYSGTSRGSSVKSSPPSGSYYSSSRR